MNENTVCDKSADLMYNIKRLCIKIHRTFGFGLLENAYRKLLVALLKKEGYEVLEEVPIPISFENVKIENAFRADIIVNNSIIIELKAVEELNKSHFLQLATYLQLSDIPQGLLVNFHSPDIFKGMFTTDLNELRKKYSPYNYGKIF